MNNNDRNFMAQKIRAQYMEKQPSALDALRALDARVKRPAAVFAYTFGSISAMVMGAGMSLVMTDLGKALGMNDAMIPGITIGIVGLLMAAINYPIYTRLLAARRTKYADQILALSDRIMEQ